MAGFDWLKCPATLERLDLISPNFYCQFVIINGGLRPLCLTSGSMLKTFSTRFPVAETSSRYRPRQ